MFDSKPAVYEALCIRPDANTDDVYQALKTVQKWITQGVELCNARENLGLAKGTAADSVRFLSEAEKVLQNCLKITGTGSSYGKFRKKEPIHFIVNGSVRGIAALCDDTLNQVLLTEDPDRVDCPDCIAISRRLS